MSQKIIELILNLTESFNFKNKLFVFKIPNPGSGILQ